MINEKCWILIGHESGDLWWATAKRKTEGGPADVGFDAKWVLDREERRGDIVGFLHTHPSWTATPSSIDLSTMRTWTDCLGKPLLCLIDGTDGLRAYSFEADNKSDGYIEYEVQVKKIRRLYFGTTIALLGEDELDLVETIKEN